MGRIEVVPAALRDVGAGAQSVGSDVTGLAGHAGALASGSGAAPSSTAAALEGFGRGWSAGVAQLGDAVAGLGLTTDLAAGLYERTDEGAMPAR